MQPNPSTGIYQISVREHEEVLYAMVFDLTGKAIQTFELDPGSNINILDLSGQSDGIYLLRVTNGISNRYWRLVKMKE